MIPDKSVTLASDVSVAGITFTATAKRTLTGDGKLTIGADGLAVTSGGSEINLKVPIHLAADQTWTRSSWGMISLDGNRSVTAESGVTWTISGSWPFRINAQGRLGSDVTVILRDWVELSPNYEATGRGLGSPVLVFEGSGVRASFGSEWCTSIFDERYASRLCLRSGASLSFNSSTLCRFEVPELTVDGDAADSRLKGGLVRLASGQTVFDVSEDHTLTIDAVLTNAPNATATVVKRGAGTLTLANPEEPVDFTVSEGTLKFAFPGYRYYRFKIDAAYGSKAIGAQISEFKLLDGETAITGAKASYAEGTALSWNLDVDDCAPSEDPTKAADGSLGTKWMDRRAGATRVAAEGDDVWVQLDYGTPVRPTGYSWATANDWASGDSCCDPKDWRLLASDDGENWVELDRQTNKGPYEPRKAWVGEFPVTYPSGRGASAKLGHVIVEAGGTLDLRGFTSATMAGGSVENRGGTILTDAGTLTGNSVSVFGGTLACGPFGGRFFRVTITGNGGASETSFNEFSLYAADGSRINKGSFEKVSADSPAALAANQCLLTTSTGEVTYGYEDLPKVFDGNASTKLTVFKLTPSEEQPITFAFRLPDSAASAVGYTFTTAFDATTNANSKRSPTSWTVEGSFDGETWCVLDGKAGATTPTTNSTEYNGGEPYSIAPQTSDSTALAFGGGPVSVAAGATLDLRSETLRLSHLVVDCDAGAGTITRFTPEPNGILDLTIADASKVSAGFVVPLTVGTIANAKNLSTWTVRVNGVAKECLRLRYRDGNLVLVGCGTRIILR